jgi:uncharacterized protein
MGRALWAAGLPARALLLGLLRVYRTLISPMLGPRCRFYPSCSAYAEEAVRAHGAAKGTALAVWRVLRCSPLSAGGVDPVPPSDQDPGTYDAVAQERA